MRLRAAWEIVVSNPDIEWWRRRALGWKRLAKRQRARAEWSDRPVLVGKLTQEATQENYNYLVESLSALSDRWLIVADHFDIEFIEPQSVVLKRLLEALAEWREEWEQRDKDFGSTVYTRDLDLARVYDELPERVKKMGEGE
jgi:hypothetical protein